MRPVHPICFTKMPRISSPTSRISDTVINLIHDEEPVDVLEDVPPIVEKVKKVRISRKKKEVEPPVEVSEDDDELEVVEPEVAEDSKQKEDNHSKVVEIFAV